MTKASASPLNVPTTSYPSSLNSFSSLDVKITVKSGRGSIAFPHSVSYRTEFPNLAKVH